MSSDSNMIIDNNTVISVVKIIICGEPRVGKSSLLKSISENEFDDSYLPTTMSDLTLKEIIINDKPVGMCAYIRFQYQ
jgi:GTPase SAR1 family protein